MSTSLTHFWCHSCKSDLFQPSSIYTCLFCNSELIEEVEQSSAHPSSFTPSGISRQPSPFQNISITFFQFPLLIPPSNPTPEISLQSLPQITSSTQDCLICQESISSGIRMPCSHDFHEECLIPWLRQKNSCPTCRTSI